MNISTMTTPNQHTAGPWHYDPTDRTIWFGAADPITIAELVDGDDMGDPEQIDADGYLIAAAPDLIVALEAAREDVSHHLSEMVARSRMESPAIAACRARLAAVDAALNKARGE